MPAWSDEIAAALVHEAARRGLRLDQLQLQALVYIAHGWRLVLSSEPLTGDRPVITSFGPEYERLANALRGCGVAAVERRDLPPLSSSILNQEERELISSIIDTHATLDAAQLAAVTCEENSPWRRRLADGLGREIGHHEIRRHVERYGANSANVGQGQGYQ